MSRNVWRLSLAVVAAVGLAVVSSAGGIAAVPGLKISSFSPAGGITGTKVVITGTGFTGATSVSIGGKAAAFTVDSATQISATLPTAPLTGHIRVQTPAGAVQSAALFTVVKTPPSLPTFTPKSGVVGSKVVITGVNFAGASSVQFGGVEATFTINSSTQITAIVPPGAMTGKIRVANALGGVQTADVYTVLPTPLPSVTSFNPASGAVGTTVVIKGTGFTAITSVQFGGSEATFTVNSPTQITAKVPASAVTGKIKVTNYVGSAQSSAVFTVIHGKIIINSFRPDSSGGPYTWDLTGVNFTGVTSVTAGGLSVAFRIVSDSLIEVDGAAGNSSGLISVASPTDSAQWCCGFSQTPAVARG